MDPKHVQNSAAVATVYNYIPTKDIYGSRIIIVGLNVATINWLAWKLQNLGYVTYHPISLDEHFPFLDIEEIENLTANLFFHSEEIRSSQDTSYTVLLLLAEENAKILADKREPADCRVGPLSIHTRHDLKSWSQLDVVIPKESCKCQRR
jgi:hypothetical protein